MKLSKLLLPVALIGLAMTSMVGCGGGGHHDTYYNGWYDAFGGRCGNLGPGCNYYANGLKIIDVEDPYWTPSAIYQFAVWDYYNPLYGPTDIYGYNATYVGYAWLSPDNILYDDFGNALNEEKSQGRNVVGDVAAKKDKLIKLAAHDLAARYEMSEEAAVHITKSLDAWNVMGSFGPKQPRTQQDKEDMTKRIYAIDYNDVSVALEKAQKGDLSGLTAMTDDLAHRWLTTPQKVKNMQMEWFGDQLKYYGYDTSSLTK
jgi:hypothetical protein